jgi:hypothetical protein
MTAERWRRGRGDEALRREVESLLTQRASAKGFVDGPAVAVAAPLVSDVGASLLVELMRMLRDSEKRA